MTQFSKEWWKERLPYIKAFIEGNLHLGRENNGYVRFTDPIECYQILERRPYSIDNPEVLSLIGKTIYRNNEPFTAVLIGKNTVSIQSLKSFHTQNYTYQYLLNNFSFSNKEKQPVGILS